MESSELKDLCQAIVEGPAVLFLGQSILQEYAGKDLFLSTSATRFGLGGEPNLGDLLHRWRDEDSAQLSNLLHNISIRIAVPESLQVIGKLPWNAVLTSCFHEIVDRALQADWRTVGPVLDRRSPAEPRSRQRLNLFKLFGSVESDRAEEQPPWNSLQLLQRRAIAQEMLGRLPELVTPRGVLLIDGFGARDWIKAEVLADQIALLGQGQAHLFGVSEDSEQLENFQLLVEAGKLQIHFEPLFEIVNRALEAGLLLVHEQLRNWMEGVRLSLRSGQERVFEPMSWRRLTRGLPVLSDADLESPPQLASREENYRAFREFVYGTHGTPRWQHYNRGFQFRRSKYQSLVDLVDSELSKPRLKEKPILLVGPSGVGKTVALADLALTMRRKKWQVVFLAKTYTEIDYAQIGAVCEALEDIDQTSTLVIWDALNDVHVYESLASFLASRGRKALVVGSSYSMGKGGRGVEYSPTMDSREAEMFIEHLRSIDNQIVDGVNSVDFENRHFLAWLWRLLPEARGTLRAGLLREFELAEYALDRKQLLQQAVQPRPGSFGALLKEALGDAFSDAFDGSSTIELRDASGQEAEKVQRLSGLVIIPGRWGQDVPVELVLRSLGAEGFNLLRRALQKVPVYQWIEDERGNQLVGTRHRVEAEIIARARFTREEELEVIKLLIKNVRLQSDWQIRSGEVDFLERMLRAIGPESVRNTSAVELEAIADTLSELRKLSGIRSHPRLMFQEGHFRREAILRLRNELPQALDLAGHVTRIIDQYEKAREALEHCELAYQETDQPRRHAYALSFLHTEFASLFGYAQEIQSDIAKREPNSRAIESLNETLREGFSEAVRHCKIASAYSSENAYPADVRFRVTKAQLGKAGNFSRVELVSELCDVLDENSWRHEPERYDVRRLELAGILEDDSLRTEALASLSKRGSLAGNYFVSWTKIFYPDRTFRDREQVLEGLHEIEQMGRPAMFDEKLVRLYCRAWWQAYGNPSLFFGERVTAKLMKQNWEAFGLWLAQRVSFSEEASAHARFTYAWTLFQCGEYGKADDQFRVLDRETSIGKYRVIRLATWCDEHGEPIKCDGTIRRTPAGSERGYVYVPTLRREVPFQVGDFSGQDLTRGERLNDFYISFNFLGPIADPVRYFKR